MSVVEAGQTVTQPIREADHRWEAPSSVPNYRDGEGEGAMVPKRARSPLCPVEATRDGVTDQGLSALPGPARLGAAGEGQDAEGSGRWPPESDGVPG